MADDIARLGYEIDSTQALSAARNLLTMEQAAGRAATGAARLTTRFRDANGRFISNTRAVAENSREIEQLAAKYNTALSAELSFANAQKEVSRAVQLGVLSAEQADAALERLQASYLASGNAATVMGGNVASANRHILNMGFQFQDIGMMMASGQSPLILAMQQGTQVAGIFNQMKMEGQSAFVALRGGLLGLINPTSLLTIGVIAGAAALVQWGMAAVGASGDSQTLTEATDDLIDAMDRYRTALSASEQLTTQLLERYGTQAQAMRTNLELMARLERIRFTTQVEEGVARLRSDLSELRQIANGIASIGETTPPWLQRWTDDFGVTREEAVLLGAAIDDLGGRQTPDELANTLERVSRILVTARERGGAVTDEMISTTLEALRAAAAARELAGALADASTNAASIQVPQGQIVDEAGNVTQFGLGSRARQPPRRAPVMDSLSIGSSGSGGGGNSAEMQRESELQQLIDSLQTETETIQEWRTSQLELLAQYNDAELAAVGGQAEARLRIEQEYQDRMIALRGTYQGSSLEQTQRFMGDMASALSSGNQQMAAAAAVFAGIEATINAYRAFNQVLADPKLPWFAKIPSAIGVLAAGLRTVQAIKSAGGSSGGSSGATSSASASTVSQAPEATKTTVIELRGSDWAKNIIGPVIDEIYKQSSNGRVIFKS